MFAVCSGFASFPFLKKEFPKAVFFWKCTHSAWKDYSQQPVLLFGLWIPFEKLKEEIILKRIVAVQQMRRKETISKVLAKLAFSKHSPSQLAAWLNEECSVIAFFLSIMYVYLVISPYIHGSFTERKYLQGCNRRARWNRVKLLELDLHYFSLQWIQKKAGWNNDPLHLLVGNCCPLARCKLSHQRYPQTLLESHTLGEETKQKNPQLVSRITI